MTGTISFQEDTLAFLAAAALDRYEEDFGALMLAPMRGARFRLWCDVEGLRQACAQLPQLWAHWMAVLISHHEVLDGLDAGPADARVREALRRHSANVARLGRECRRLCERDG